MREPAPGVLADGMVKDLQAHREDTDALGPVLAGDPDDRAAFPVVGGFDRDGARQVAAGALERLASRVQEALVLGAGVPLELADSVLGDLSCVLVRHLWPPSPGAMASDIAP